MWQIGPKSPRNVALRCCLSNVHLKAGMKFEHSLSDMIIVSAAVQEPISYILIDLGCKEW